METSYISRICVRRRIRLQIRAYFSGYVSKLREKIENQLRIESYQYRFLSAERKSADQSAIPQYSVKTGPCLDFIWHVLVRSEAYFFFSLAVS